MIEKFTIQLGNSVGQRAWEIIFLSLKGQNFSLDKFASHKTKAEIS